MKASNIDKNTLFSFPKIAIGNKLLHEFHISKTDINYDLKSNALQFTVHVFIDDLEKALNTQGKKDIGIGSNKENAKADEWISQYLSSKLNILAGSVKINPTFLGKELSDDKIAIYCYFEYIAPKTISEMTITNNILHEIYTDQKNVTSLTKNRKRIAHFIFDHVKDKETVAL